MTARQLHRGRRHPRKKLSLFSSVQNLYVGQETGIRTLYGTTEKAMAPHSSTLAWKIPWMEEPGGL